MAVHDASPRLFGVVPKADALSTFHIGGDGYESARHPTGGDPPIRRPAGSGGAGPSRCGVPRRGGAFLPGGLFLQGNRRYSGSAHWNSQIPYFARAGATQRNLHPELSGSASTGKPTQTTTKPNRFSRCFGLILLPTSGSSSTMP